jgi:hypothetical protein
MAGLTAGRSIPFTRYIMRRRWQLKMEILNNDLLEVHG